MSEGWFVAPRELRAAVATVGRHEMALYPPGTDCVSDAIASGNYEGFEAELLNLLVRPGDACIDVGAHVGFFTLKLCDLVGPAGAVLAFEPDADNYALLCDNLRHAGYRNVVARRVALMGDNATRHTVRTPGNSGDSRVGLGREPLPVTGETPCARLDDLIAPGTAVNFVKIDVQGREVHALSGMRRVVAEQSRLTMLVEYWPWGIREAGGDERDFFRLLGGFQLYVLDEGKKSMTRVNDPHYLANPETQHFVNLVCTR